MGVRKPTHTAYANHLPQFPRFYSEGRIKGRPCLVIELLEPIDIPSSDKGVASYLLEVCACVRALHLSGLVHRDLKPKNCIVRNHAAEPLGKVGIAYDLQDGAGLDLPELDEPDDHGQHHIERSGSPTCLTFKGTGL